MNAPFNPLFPIQSTRNANYDSVTFPNGDPVTVTNYSDSNVLYARTDASKPVWGDGATTVIQPGTSTSLTPTVATISVRALEPTQYGLAQS